MIESGLSIWALANPNLTPFLGQTPSDAAKKIYSAFYYSFLPKEPTGATPGLILDLLKLENAEDTLDARSNAPGESQTSRFQFGSVANDSPQNPKNASGYLSAVLLSRALRRELTGLATGRAALPDGTLITDVFDWNEFDAHYEVGGIGYLYRRVLQVTIVFEEPVGS